MATEIEHERAAKILDDYADGKTTKEDALQYFENLLEGTADRDE